VALLVAVGGVAVSVIVAIYTGSGGEHGTIRGWLRPSSPAAPMRATWAACRRATGGGSGGGP
jgi:hypothetical protein